MVHEVGGLELDEFAEGFLRVFKAALAEGFVPSGVGLADAVAARIAMGREGYQPEYDIYPKGLTDPWESRRFGVGEALYASLGIPRDNKAGRLAQFMDNYRGFGAPVMLFLHCSRIMGPPQWSDMGMWLQSVMLLLVEHGLASCPQECWASTSQNQRDLVHTPKPGPLTPTLTRVFRQMWPCPLFSFRGV